MTPPASSGHAFAEQDTTEENLRTLGGWLERYGRPLAHYTDKNSIFRTTRRAGIGEQLQGERGPLAVGRALKELGIEWIAAQSPQPKVASSGSRDPAGPPGEGNASSGNRYDRSGESLFRNTFSSGVGAAFFYGGTTSSPQCASTAGARTASGRNPERAGRAPGGRHHVSWGWKTAWGCPGEVCAGLRGAQVKSNGGWMARTGCVSAAAICTCAPARTRCDRQVLPAYGLQDLPIKEQSPQQNQT